jgi:hypothetical protein
VCARELPAVYHQLFIINCATHPEPPTQFIASISDAIHIQHYPMAELLHFAST